ncbi:uncharacterized protein YKR070W isoform X2 [Argentina anserina]|uniref:uncharacterized protein YKR070W isoform X2 n=1 Tax=Argentina anserina TaxID=57926 RepID=UPI002176231D|nr:uncharacterized protein YKR070W isoform X2 [Potentilla anserina]
MSPMRYRTAFGSKSRLLFTFRSRPYSSESRIQCRPEPRPSFGIAFDIDGVILGGRAPIGGSPRALKKLYGDSGNLKIPFVFLTNGGGIPESRRAAELSEVLGVNILPSQVVQGHTPFRNLVRRYENELIVAVGKGEPALVMSEYGFKKVLSLDEYASYFKNIDPVAQYKLWRTKQALDRSSHLKDSVPRYNVYSERVSAAFVVSDPVDWGRDIQVLCDILRSGGIPGWKNCYQPDLYFAADDLEYQAAFPSQRLGMGALRIALESIFNRIHHNNLEYVTFGKPNPFVFKNTEALLAEFQPSQFDEHISSSGCSQSHDFKTLYMIGDNPLVDVKGAQQAGRPWFSILTRTGVFKGKDNHKEFPADMVVDTVEEAVDFILRREGAS